MGIYQIYVIARIATLCFQSLAVEGGEFLSHFGTKRNIVCAAQYSLLSEDFQILCVPLGRTHDRTPGCKWSLLEVREGKYKGSMVGTGRIWRQRKSMFLFSRYF
jgi:hypothetical protein